MGQPHPIDVYVGTRLRIRRKILGISQDAVATEIGITFQQVQKYEKGVNRMGASRLYQFSKLLNVPVSYFFEGFDEEEGANPSGLEESKPEGFEYEHLSKRETLELLRSYYKITSPSVRKRVYDLIRSMANETSAADA